MFKKLAKYKIWDRKYPQAYYKFNNKIFHSRVELYEYLKENKLK